MSLRRSARPRSAPPTRAAAVLLAMALAGTGPTAAQAPATPRLVVAIAPARGLTVGDRVTATLTLDVPTTALGGAPRFPAWQKTWGEAEVAAAGEVEKVSGGESGLVTYRQRLVLAAFRPGSVALPPAAVAVPLRDRTVEVSTPPGLALEIGSVLPKDAKEGDLEPKPPAAPRPLPWWSERFGWTAGSFAAAALVLGLLLARRRTAAVEAAAPPLAPLAELDRELERLAGEESAVRAHTRLSLAVRRYLGRTLSFPALESTTSEVQRRLLGGGLPAPLVRRAVELLRACDLVKFARQEAGGERLRERVEAARGIGGEVERHLRPPAEAALEPPLEATG